MRRRVLLAAGGLAAGGFLATARGLTPDPRGFGTHEQLGLAPCAFTRWANWPCPSCGMTTAWAHAARGDVTAALVANSGGAVLFGLTIMAAVWALGSAAAGRWLRGRPSARVLLWIGSAWLAATMLDWARRLANG